MSNEGVPDKAFFSWLDEHTERAEEWAERAARLDNIPDCVQACAATRRDTLREVRAYFGGAW